MTGERPWTDLERIVLINTSKEKIPTLAEMMDRPFEEVASKHEQLQAIANSQYQERVKKLIEEGMKEDDAYLKVVDEDKMKFREILDI